MNAQEIIEYIRTSQKRTPRDQCMMSHVISARSATSSVHAQSRDLDLISHVISACRVT